jgi:putative ABC transport system permease protein
MKLAAIGILIGLGGAVAATRLLRNLLFGVSPIDPVTFILVPLLLSAVTLLGLLHPRPAGSKGRSDGGAEIRVTSGEWRVTSGE